MLASYFGVGKEELKAKAAEILARPEGHAGKTYRPTGPKLVSPQEIAATFAKVLGRKVTYRNVPMWMLTRVLKSAGLPHYAIAAYTQYAIDYQKNAFAVNAPTDVVRTITGKEPEDVETIARRYVSNTPEARPSFATQFKRMLVLIISLLRPAPRTTPYLALGEFSDKKHVVFSADSPEWRQSHEPQGSELSGEKTEVWLEIPNTEQERSKNVPRPGRHKTTGFIV